MHIKTSSSKVLFILDQSTLSICLKKGLNLKPIRREKVVKEINT